MPNPLQVLLIEEGTDNRVQTELRNSHMRLHIEQARDRKSFLTALDHFSFDLILSDYVLPKFTALEALAILKERHLDIPFLIISTEVGEATAVEAMKAGAQDFLMKSNLARLMPAVERELKEHAIRREHKNLEDQLRQAQKMEAMGRLAGGVAHDFNNLISAISGYVQLALETLKPQSPAYSEIVEIQKATEQAGLLTRQLLAFSRKETLQPQRLDLNQIIRDMEKMIRHSLGEHVELITRLADGLPPIHVDPGQVQQVLLNLTLNARDAMPEGGRLMIRTAQQGAYIALQVQDTGTGVDAETLPHLFEPFFSTKAKGKGTGLGLATVYRVIQHAGGFIQVDSKPGNGMLFKIFLPAIAT
jgi:two-component system cell cycle sensor histidine kinase/response regulator CckA